MHVLLIQELVMNGLVIHVLVIPSSTLHNRIHKFLHKTYTCTSYAEL